MKTDSFIFALSYLSIRTYADSLSPKVVQALLDLLCSQLKTLLALAAGSTLSASTELQEKTDDCADAQKKDFRGRTIAGQQQHAQLVTLFSVFYILLLFWCSIVT